MHYRVHGETILTELTAKPRLQASSILCRFLSRIGRVNSVLDYGCGRLRYAPELIRAARQVTFVDSEEQLSKLQVLYGRRTTIRVLVRDKWPSARVLNVQQLRDDMTQYDFILCANVLPVIPSKTARSEVLQLLINRLSGSGHCLFVSQYRNSDFKKMAARPNSKPHLDGWLLKGANVTTFFGLLDKDRMATLATGAGFEAEECWIEGQSAYVLCSSNNSTSQPDSHHESLSGESAADTRHVQRDRLRWLDRR